MAQRLSGKTVVITGASSGIGRATAISFAREGATVVLAARREQALHEVATEVHNAGGRAMVIPTDVRDPAQMQRLAARAIDAFDGIDIWVNNAGASAFGKFEEIPQEAFHAVMDITFYGVVNGIRAVLPHFKERGQGTIITTASVVGRVPSPYQSPYVAAKHAVMGFIEAVRQEVDQDGFEDIYLCAVLPGPVDTPFWQHAGNYSGREIQALPGMVEAEKVADAILSLAFKPQREVGVGVSARLLELGMAVAGGRLERFMGRMTQDKQFKEAAHGRDNGTLGRPDPFGTGTSGGWMKRSRAKKKAGLKRHAGSIGLGGLLALAVPIGAAAYYAANRRH
ncbi:SDR family oxidoreductase [Indioceanicola profundi]|uniref:SDR family oxidoreductase n=1 Tax=Indioceanicola profundi TaxID=2220096 RepID=UPI000E6AB6D2|nr:SDR family oxidoreductase [Indioceanicola profundi]